MGGIQPVTLGKRQGLPHSDKRDFHRLEYLGYDGAGLALVNREGVLKRVQKARGKVADLEHFVESKDLDGTVGIAHTRWATRRTERHQRPSHYSDSGNIALIHNGTSKVQVLKEALIENGYTIQERH